MPYASCRIISRLQMRAIKCRPAHEGVRPVPAGQMLTKEQRIFDYSKHLRNAGPLTSDNDKDLCFVAMDWNSVFLTPLSRHFWQLASGGNL
jgi:hypothetical protein